MTNPARNLSCHASGTWRIGKTTWDGVVFRTPVTRVDVQWAPTGKSADWTHLEQSNVGSVVSTARFVLVARNNPLEDLAGQQRFLHVLFDCNSSAPSTPEPITIESEAWVLRR